ncbi:MAG: c-type cytochrome [Pirellulaceae bacterium]
MTPKRFSLSVLLYPLLLISAAQPSLSQAPEDQPTGPALSPKEALQQFQTPPKWQWESLLHEPQISQPLMTSFDPAGRLWVVQYLQYPEPAGIQALSRDQFWRIVYDKLPIAPGREGHVAGRDKITIHEDRDADGTLETETVFVDGLNIATAVAPTTDGAWVLNPPYLLFFADRDQDGRSDGNPEVHLEGFGLEDTHSVANSLCFGPDGWLYAAQGSTVTAAIRSNSQDPPIKSLGQLIWRYHPIKRIYEIFAEGGGNAFGVAIDDHGEIFSGHNGGDTRGFHYQQGGYYRKGFTKHGSLSNPYSFGYLLPMQHDPIQRFSHTLLMLQGTALADPDRPTLLAVDPLHGKLIETELLRRGATFATKDLRDAVSSQDKWFRPVAIQDGPDGAAYVCDWYDFQVAHLYAHVGKMDRDHGRVYRLSPNRAPDSTMPLKWNPAWSQSKDISSLRELVDTLEHPYRWQRSMARRLIADHPLKDQAVDRLLQMSQSTSPHALEYLWTLHLCGYLADTLLADSDPALQLDPTLWLTHPDPHVRAWIWRLMTDDGQLQAERIEPLRTAISQELDPIVLAQIASSMIRIPAEQAVPLLGRLLQRPIDPQDPTLPLMAWWAVERHADQHALILPELLERASCWQHPLLPERIAPNLIQRWLRQGTRESYHAAQMAIAKVADQKGPHAANAIAASLQAFEQAFEGRSLAGVPNELLEQLAALGPPTTTLKLRRGDAEAVTEVIAGWKDPTVPPSLKVQWIRILGELPQSAAMPELLTLATDANTPASLRDAALASLSRYDQPQIASRLIEVWPTMEEPMRKVAGMTLASRLAWSLAWRDAVVDGKVDAQSLPIEAVRAMRLHPDPQLLQSLDPWYPPTGSIDFATAQQKVASFSAMLQEKQGDPYAGKKLFTNHCGRCHRLFDQGGQIGPDLTSYQRDQLASLLLHIVAPNLEVREGYQSFAALTEEDVLLVGFIESDLGDELVLKGVDGQAHGLRRSQLQSLTPQTQSLMPEGLLDALSSDQVRDLLAYLRSSQPLHDGT